MAKRSDLADFRFSKRPRVCGGATERNILAFIERIRVASRMLTQTCYKS